MPVSNILHLLGNLVLLPLYLPRESIAEVTTIVTDLLQPDLRLVISNNGNVPHVIDRFDSVKKFLQKYGIISTC